MILPPFMKTIFNPSVLAALLTGVFLGCLPGGLLLPAAAQENPNEALLVAYPKWRLQPAPFTLAQGATGYSPEALDNAFHSAAESVEASFFDVMDSNSDLQSLAKISDLSEISLRWEGIRPDYLLINPTFSMEAGANLTLTAQLCLREPFMRVKSISSTLPAAAGLEALMAQFWSRLDMPMPVLKKNARGLMEADSEKTIANIREIALPGILDVDGNVAMFSFNALNNIVSRASQHTRLIRPHRETGSRLISARWGRNAQAVDLLGIDDQAPAGPDGRMAYRVLQNITVPRELFGEGFQSSFVQMEHATFTTGKDRNNYLSACYYYLGGLGDYPQERYLVFVNHDPSTGTSTTSVMETRFILGAYGAKESARLLEPGLRAGDRPSVRMDPNGKVWTWHSPAGGGLLVFANVAEAEGAFAAIKPLQVPKILEAVCQYRPEPGEQILDHAFTPNGRAIVLLLARQETEGGKAGGNRRIVLWDYRGDRGTVVGSSRTSKDGLYNGGHPVIPMSTQEICTGSGLRLPRTIRFGDTSPQSSNALLIVGYSNSDYEVWRISISATPPAPGNHDRDTIVSGLYFSGSFPPAYAKLENACPLAIEPALNRVFIGGVKRVEILQLYPDLNPVAGEVR